MTGSLLEVNGLRVGYGATTVLHNLSMEVGTGQVVAVLGPNGAGKTTLLRTLSGLTRIQRGSISFDGRDASRLAPHKIVAAGIAHVPEGRRMFPHLSTEANLRLGTYVRRDREAAEADLAAFLERWPVIGRRRNSKAGLLSGGEQQIVALGRALLSRPKLLLLDEPSLGLAPVLVAQLYATLHELVAASAQTVLLVEQNAHQALKVADVVYVLRGGQIRLRAAASSVTADDVADLYFAAEQNRHSNAGEPRR